MHFGYVDDAAMLGHASSLQESAANATKLANEATKWGAENGLSFSSGKTELQHFHLTCETEPSVTIGPDTIPPNKATRWLGIYLDTRLDFHLHVRTMTSRAARATAHVRSLANAVRGVPANLLRLAATAAVFPVLLYGASIWYHGSQRHLDRGNLDMARQRRLIDMISKVTTNVAKAIVPAYRTTPHAALYREAGILPAPLMLDRCRRDAAVRATGLDEHHPLARMIRSRASTRLTLRHSELPRAPLPPRFLPLDHPPPRPPDIKDARQIRAAKVHITRIPPWDVQIFSDGSKLQDGSTGAAAVLYAAGHTLPTTAAHLGEAMEAKAAAPNLKLGSIQRLLGTPEGAIHFAKYLAASNFLTEYAVPTHHHPKAPLPVAEPVERPQPPNQ
ncbi:hypothetical protein BROUX41_001011 [Berkeleyomyces rouxiae]